MNLQSFAIGVAVTAAGSIVAALILDWLRRQQAKA